MGSFCIARAPQSQSMNEKPKLSDRLGTAAEMVRAGAVVADVGTDHAYLPIALCLSGRATRAIAADIHEGPLARARENICAWGLEDRIETRLTDGLCGLEGAHPTDVLILGMGGELIARILSDAPFVRDGAIRLILQPMTHPEVVRAYLAQNGFTIVEERLIKEEKIYQIFCAEYTGICEEYTPLERLVGKQNLARRDATTYELCARWRSVFETRLQGKKTVGGDVSEEERILAEIQSWEDNES